MEVSMKKIRAFALAVAMLAWFSSLDSQVKHGHSKGELEEVGEVHFSISSDRPETQEEFNRATAMLYSFAYPQARKAFYDLTMRDPKCAMAYWGIAMSYFHPIWQEVPTPEDVKTSLKAIRNAKYVGIKTNREKDYIASIEAFYMESDSIDYPTRVLNYEKAMEQMVLRYPDDDEAKVLYALVLDATALKTDKTYAKQKKAGELLLKVFAKQPNHPGIVHYIIHAYDYPPLAELGLNAARKYAKIAPSVPHALHMPSHIFVRLGLWEDNIATNIASANAGLELARTADPANSSFDALHAWDYMTYGYLQLAQDKKAKEVVEMAGGVLKIDRSNFAAAYALAAIPARYALERKDWSAVASLSLHPENFPWDRFPMFASLTYFAKALGAARGGNVAAAHVNIEKLRSLHQRTLEAKDNYWANQVEILVQSATAWALLAEGKNDEAVKMMRSAADMEDASDKNPVTPGSLVPQRELLGDLLLESKNPQLALAEFEASLAIAKNRYNSIAGAAKAAEQSGNREKAKSYYLKLVELCAKSDTQRPDVEKAKAFLAER